jgi:hypothetical protein
MDDDIVFTENGTTGNLLDFAWALIANAHGGDWDRSLPAWKQAAERWRDEYRDWLASRPQLEPVDNIDPPTEADCDWQN